MEASVFFQHDTPQVVRAVFQTQLADFLSRSDPGGLQVGRRRFKMTRESAKVFRYSRPLAPFNPRLSLPGWSGQGQRTFQIRIQPGRANVAESHRDSAYDSNDNDTDQSTQADRLKTEQDRQREANRCQSISDSGLFGVINESLYFVLDVPFTKLGKHIEARRRAEGVYPPKEIYIPSPDDLQQCFDD